MCHFKGLGMRFLQYETRICQFYETDFTIKRLKNLAISDDIYEREKKVCNVQKIILLGVECQWHVYF